MYLPRRTGRAAATSRKSGRRNRGKRPARMVFLMITYTTGNLLEANVDALVNTVNTVGVMGKGIALMFKEAYRDNFKSYEAACKSKRIEVGHVFVTRNPTLLGPTWIVNFPTKKHWRHPSKMDWIVAGLKDLRQFILDKEIQSIAVPPLGSGNGGLEWHAVKKEIQKALGDLPNTQVFVYEPTTKYQNVAKRQGVKKLTPARALIAELVRQYWIIGIECTVLEIQKLAYFLERAIENGPAKSAQTRFPSGQIWAIRAEVGTSSQCARRQLFAL